MGMVPVHGSHCSCDDCRPLTTRSLEGERIESWRLKTLLEAGYSLVLAEQLAAAEVDLHTAVEYVRQGCEPALAAEILL